MVMTADLIMFAIQGAIRLGLEARQAYVDSTLNRALALPLPDFKAEVTAQTAIEHYTEYPNETGDKPRLQALMAKKTPLSAEEQHEVLTYYNEDMLVAPSTWKNITPTAEGTFFTQDFVAAMVTVRQWGREDEGTIPPLQRVAGTLIELGVDYFGQVPGALNDNSRQGKVIKAVLTALDGIDLADKPLSTLPERLMTATIEAVGAGAEASVSDPAQKDLIQTSASSLARDVANRITQLRSTQGANAIAEDSIAGWAETVFRSLITSAGEAVAKDPAKYLSASPGEQALISKVGSAVLDTVLAQRQGNLAAVFSTVSLNTLVETAMAVVADHPELVAGTGHTALGDLLKQMAGDLAKFDTLVDSRNLPAIVNVILAQTEDNLESLWPAATRNPSTHLLLTATKTVLSIMTDKLHGSGISLSSNDVFRVVNAVVAEVTANPAWIIKDAAGVDPILATALQAALGVLAGRGNLLSSSTVTSITIAAVSAVSLNLDLVKGLPDDSKTVIAALLNIALGVCLDGEDPAVQWRTTRPEVVVGIAAVVLQEGTRVKIDPATLTKIQNAVGAYVNTLRNGAAWDSLALAKALQAAA